MPAIGEIAQRVIETFDATSSLYLHQAISNAFTSELGPYAAADLADDRIAARVHAYLSALDPRQLPFDIFGRRLVGKRRIRADDSRATEEIRNRYELVRPMLTAVYECGHLTFERISARLILASGATESFALGTSDEGGIDIYGRWPLETPDSDIPEGLVSTSLSHTQLLFLGQCKAINPTASIDRGEIQKFHAQVSDCLDKYEDNDEPPSHRVPPHYYRKDELCLRYYVTTGGYTSKAKTAAAPKNIILIDGRKLAEYLLYQGIGIRRRRNRQVVNKDDLVEWANGAAVISSMSIGR